MNCTLRNVYNLMFYDFGIKCNFQCAITIRFFFLIWSTICVMLHNSPYKVVKCAYRAPKKNLLSLCYTSIRAITIFRFTARSTQVAEHESKYMIHWIPSHVPKSRSKPTAYITPAKIERAIQLRHAREISHAFQKTVSILAHITRPVTWPLNSSYFT